MPVPSSMQDLATLAASNSPAGTEVIGNSLDNYIRALSAILRSTNALASATIASASTTDLASADAESVQVTGSATITSLGTGFNGCYREVRFTGACTLTHSANLVMPSATNVTTVAGDVVSFRCVGSGQWVMVGYNRPAGGLGYTPVNKAGDTMTGNLTLQNDAAGNDPRIRISSTGATGVNGLEFYNSSTFKGGLFHNKANDDISILTAADGTNSRLMIKNSGLVGIGTDSPNTKLHVVNGAVRAEGTGAGLEFIGQPGSPATRWVWYAASGFAYLFNNVAANNVVSVTEAGVVTAANFIATSDERLKDNLEQFEPRDLSGLPLFSWDWTNGLGGGRGHLAQMIQTKAPEYVHEGADGRLAVDHIGMLLERVAYLEQRVKGLSE